jgi:hypothetical protein
MLSLLLHVYIPHFAQFVAYNKPNNRTILTARVGIKDQIKTNTAEYY